MTLADPDLTFGHVFRTSTKVSAPLRVGVLMDNRSTLACFREVMLDIVSSNFCELSCVIYNGEDSTHRLGGTTTPRGRLRLWRDRFRLDGALFRAYLRFVDTRYAREPNPTHEVDCSDMLDRLPALTVQPIRTGFTHRLSEGAIARIKAERLDVLLRFGFNILRGGILEAARCGIWSYHHGDNEYYRGGPSMLWELIERNPASGAVLQVLNEGLDAGLVLCKVTTTTSPAPSVAANRFAPYWIAEHFVIRKLKEVYESGWDAVRAKATPSTSYKGRKRIYRSPSNIEMAVWATTVTAKKLRACVVGPKTPNHWQVAIRESAVSLFDDPSPAQLSAFRLLTSPAETYWADPFLFEREGRMWLFFEEFDYAAGMGHLSCGHLSPDGRLCDVREVLRQPYHLSYPMVFDHAGEIYMIPESFNADGVDLYVSRGFPDRWVKVKRLFDFRAVDATPVYVDQTWWMFLSPVVVAGHTPILLLFSAPDIFGPWDHVSASPILGTPEGARSAGSIVQSADV